jgi:uncharacterized membrane protein
MTPFAAISFANAGWGWAALLGTVVLVPLTWLALRPAGPQAGARAFGLGLRTLGLGLLLLCLLDPQWVSTRPKKGANFLAILADNSQSMQIADADQPVSRGQKVRAELTTPGTAWLEKVADDFQVRPYLFDRDLRRVRDFSELDFQGTGTALGAALKQLRERYAGAPGQAAQPLAGILLFTDGNATDLPNGLTDTGGLPPVYPVVIGSADGLRDVSIGRTAVSQTAFDDAPVSLHVEINGTGATGRDLTVNVHPLATDDAAPTPADQLPPTQTVRLANDHDPVEVKFDWHPAGSGVQFFETDVAVRSDPPFAEATLLNNRRAVMVDRGRPTYRILYVTGTPNWEFKFLNRALADDPQIELPALFRVAPREPKFSFIGHGAGTTNPLYSGFTDTNEDTQRYDQPVFERVNLRDDTELAAGFPRNAAELFAYDAVILDKVEAAMFSTDQLALLRRFTAERGGGLLMLGGVDSLEAGGYDTTPLAAVLPVYLDRKADTLPQGELTWQLTREGWLEPWTRVRALENDERARLGSMPHFLVANALKSIKPGATVLATVTDQAGQVYPSLIAQHYGAGRVAAVAVGDMWRWGMKGEQEQADLGRFWRQLARWLVTDVPAPVELHVAPAAEEAGGMTLTVTARDKEYKPLDLATVRITVRRVDAAPQNPAVAPPPAGSPAGGPAFTQVVLPAEPVADAPGKFAATFAPRDAGAYRADAEVTDRAGNVLGHAQAGWVNDPAADEFGNLAPNRALLEELARRTGGEVIPWTDLGSLAAKLARMPAPITEDISEPLWQQGWVFLAVLACFLSEWGWRRWKGLP